MTFDKIKRGYFFIVGSLIFLLIFPSLSHAGKKRGPIILGIGGGYSFFLDSDLRSYEYYYRKLIYLSEQLDLKNNFNLYVQYFPWLGLGFQLEFDHQRASYRSDLKWFGHPTPDGEIIEINHIEEPYAETWAVSSITASILYALTLRYNEKVRPYISAGVGLYFSGGDDERFFHRTRLGPKKSGNLVKLGLGIKYKITQKLAINLRGVGGTVWLKNYGFREVSYVGPEQFDFALYAETGRLMRRQELLVNSFTYLGIMLGFEYTL
jgi:hypothetical protein